MDFFNDEQLKVLANLEQHYDVWIDAKRQIFKMPYGFQWKNINGTDYLYERINREGNGKSFGPRSVKNEALFNNYHEKKSSLKDRIESCYKSIEIDIDIYRALKLPRIASQAAKILREADIRELLGNQIMVIGTNAMPAYAIEACGSINAPNRTDDFDLAWIALVGNGDERPLWDMFNAVDSTYTVNTEKPFQVRNKHAYEVEMLVAPSRVAGVSRLEKPKPVALPEQEWLLEGRHVNHVVIGEDGSPARIVAPDPRWYALQKLWMSEQDKRTPIKRPKDFSQGIALLNKIQESMPQYRLDEEFESSLPEELLPYFQDWKSTTESKPIRRW
jgi:hypothetical protein